MVRMVPKLVSAFHASDDGSLASDQAQRVAAGRHRRGERPIEHHRRVGGRLTSIARSVTEERSIVELLLYSFAQHGVGLSIDFDHGALALARAARRAGVHPRARFSRRRWAVPLYDRTIVADEGIE